MKKQNIFSSLLLGTLMLSFAAPALVKADPSATPPGGNVDAMFSSVEAGTFSPAEQAVLDASDFGGAFDGDLIGLYARSTAGGEGIYGESTSGTAGYFTTDSGMGVHGDSNTGIGGDFIGDEGIYAYALGTGYAGNFSTASGNGIYVSVPSSSFGINANGTSNLKGSIQNNDGSVNGGSVQIRDTEGLQVANSGGTVGLAVGGDGKISNPTGNVYINDSIYLDRTSPDGRDIVINGNVFGIMGGPGNPEFSFLSLIDAFGGIGSRNLGADISPLRVLDDSGLSIGNAAGTVGLTIAANGAISNTSAGTVIDSENINTLCTNLGKGAYISSATEATCKNAVKISQAGLAVEGTITNVAAGAPVMVSDTEGLWINGASDGVFWITPNGSTGTVTLSNENGSKVKFIDTIEGTGDLILGWNGLASDLDFGALASNGALYSTGGIFNAPLIAGVTPGGITLNAVANLGAGTGGGMTLNTCSSLTDGADPDVNCDTIAGTGGFTINTDSGGLTINANTGGIALNSTSGGIYNGKPGAPLRVQDGILVTGTSELRSWVYDSIDWAIDVFGDVNATGTVRGGAIGSYYEYENPTSGYRSNIIPGGIWLGCEAYPGTNLCEKRVECQNHNGTADVPIMASISNISGGGAGMQLIQIGVNYPDPTGTKDAQLYYYSSNATTPTGLRIKVLCFSPDGD